MIKTKKLYNRYGKPIDDLDFTMIHYCAMEYLKNNDMKASYSVYSIDGYLICGKVFNEFPETIKLVTSEWSSNNI